METNTEEYTGVWKEPMSFPSRNETIKAEFNGNEFPVFFVGFRTPDFYVPELFFKENYREDNYLSEWRDTIADYEKRGLEFPSEEERRVVAMIFTELPDDDNFLSGVFMTDAKGVLLKGKGQEYYFLVKHGDINHIVVLPLFRSEARIYSKEKKPILFSGKYSAFAELEKAFKRGIGDPKMVMKKIMETSTKMDKERID